MSCKLLIISYATVRLSIKVDALLY